LGRWPFWVACSKNFFDLRLLVKIQYE
jgi:hypothetical protein